MRALDRARLEGRIGERDFIERALGLEEILSQVDEIVLTPQVLRRASHPFPTPIKTLDAIHLASALTWRKHRKEEITFYTYDLQLGRAALTMGIKAEGF